MADEAAAEEDEDEFSFEGFDEYLDDLDVDSLEEPDEEEKMLAIDPDFASCGTEWLDGDDSCHRSIQIAFLRAKCRREEAHAVLWALIDWDRQTGDEAERCTSGVATKREESPLPIRAMQEADHPEAASKDLVDSFLKKNHNSWMRLEQRLSLRTGSGGYRGSAINGFKFFF